MLALLAILLIGLGLALSDALGAAAGRPDRVPGDFATIQDAVDLGTATRIIVASGSWTGATLTRPVELVCAGQCSIVEGSTFGSVGAGLVLTNGASGSSIRGFIFDDTDLGIYSSCGRLGSVASHVTVEHNTFLNNSQAVNVLDASCDQGDGWLIEHNDFVDIRADISNCGGGLGIFALNVDGVAVLHNRFRGTLAEPPCGSLFSTAAVFFSGVDNGFVNQNDFALGDGGQAFKFDVALFGFQPGGGPNRDIVVANNDMRGSDAPFFGVNLASFDGFDLAAQCNFGTTFIDHTVAGDGDSEFFTERNCRRRDIRPSEALSRPEIMQALDS